MQSKATSVEQYLAELPAERRVALQAVREVILRNLPAGYAEGMQYGMIGYFVPHSVYPAGYHCDPRQPLPFGGLASQKHYMSVYLMCLYENSAAEAAFRQAWAKTGKKLDMGKCCIRFKRLEDLPLELLGETIRRVSANEYIARYEATIQRPSRKAATAAGKAAPTTRTHKKKTAAAPSPAKKAVRQTSARKPTPKKKTTPKKSR